MVTVTLSKKTLEDLRLLAGNYSTIDSTIQELICHVKKCGMYWRNKK